MLATLTGSEKQVRWAEEIRAKRLAEIEKAISFAREDLEDDPSDDFAVQKLAQLQSAREQAERITTAATWIDSRDLNGGMLVDALTGRYNPAVLSESVLFNALHALAEASGHTVEFFAADARR